jgi:uncharacterized protein YecE (DUF72 family)
MSVFRSGTSGLVLPVPNKQAFPPEFRDKSRLTYYASLFNSIEINSSFYKVPMGSTVHKWAESVPDNFTFTFKMWKEVTHGKGSLPEIDKFMAVINEVGEKKGSLLIQLPPSTTIAKRAWLETMFKRIQDWPIAIEFRHASWYTPEIYAMADAFNVSIVLQDMPASYNILLNEKAPFVYIRFHGPAGDYKGGYTEEVLAGYALQIKTWLAAGKDVYVYFNNTIGDAVKNLNSMITLVTG